MITLATLLFQENSNTQTPFHVPIVDCTTENKLGYEVNIEVTENAILHAKQMVQSYIH